MNMIDHVMNIILARAAGAARTPDEAIQVLNVHAKVRAPSVPAAVLSCGFNIHRPTLAVYHGHGLALLPLYPTHILFDDLLATLKAAGTLGDLPTIELLWRLAGPSSLWRWAWYEEFGLIYQAISHGHLEVIKWLLRTFGNADVSICWTSLPWNDAALAGHTDVVNWAIANRYLASTHCWVAVLSTRFGDSSFMDWWITPQHDKGWVLRQLVDAHTLVNATREGAIKALDWWWAYTGQKLPGHLPFVDTVDAALSGRHPAVVAWWWSRFLEKRTPTRVFGDKYNKTRELGSFKHIEILDWYWQRFQESRDSDLGLFPHSTKEEGGFLGLLFTIRGRTTLPILQWAVEKCCFLDDQKLRLETNFFHICAREGLVDLLDLVLCSEVVLDMHWSPDMIKIAVEYGQLGVLEWWSRNWNSLPTQNLECAQSLYNAAKLDAVGVFEWWHARWFPTTTKSDWHNVFWNSIRHNACQVQLWLCDHLDHCLDFDSDRERQVFLKRCMANLTSPRPFTLDFLTTVFGSDLDSQLFKLTHSNLTMTSHANCTLTSRVPLKWGVLEALIRASNLFMLEWWLQVYLAAGVPFVLPPTFERLIATNYKQSVRRWVRDVMVTRKIPVLIQTSVGTVMPYVSQSFPF